MIGKTMMMAAFALAATGPALAQTTTAPSSDASQATMPQTADPNQTMSNGMMPTNQSSGMMSNSSSMGTMSKSDMASMKRCKAMSSTAMAKSKKCSMLMQKYPDPSGSSANSSQ